MEMNSLSLANDPTTVRRGEQSARNFFHLYATLESEIERVSTETALPHEGRRGSGYLLGVTSAIAGEGKTTVALHLAATAARNTGRDVAVVDLSLGDGELLRRLGIQCHVGLMDLLEGDDDDLAMVDAEEWQDLVVIPAGRKPSNPARVARSDRVAELMGRLRRMFDVAVVDLPAVATDNVVPLARHLDGVVMVACAGATPSEIINHALDHLGRDKILGVVLNRTKSSSPAWIRKRFGVA